MSRILFFMVLVLVEVEGAIRSDTGEKVKRLFCIEIQGVSVAVLLHIKGDLSSPLLPDSIKEIQEAFLVFYPDGLFECIHGEGASWIRFFIYCKDLFLGGKVVGKIKTFAIFYPS